MLVVGPVSCMLPARVSVLVLTTWTPLVTESKTSRVDLSGDMAIRPGELPALIPEARASVSFAALMITRPGPDVGLDMLWDAKTRVAKPLGGL